MGINKQVNLDSSAIETLWSGYRFNNCDNCNHEECKGRLDYNNLCSNLNYLKEYGVKNFEKNSKTFSELKKIMKDVVPVIFSFGAGIGLDYVGAVQNFGENVSYFLIDECEWAITKTDGYKNFEPQLPQRLLSFDDGINFLRVPTKNIAVCFFNSLFTISENTDLQNKLLSALYNKKNFYFVCNYTINSNFHLPSTEMDFIDKLVRKLKVKFNIKKFDIMDGKGIIIQGDKK
jgi:hypothetical protein